MFIELYIGFQECECLSAFHSDVMRALANGNSRYHANSC